MSSYQEGFDTHERGDYDTTLKEFRQLAEQGDAVAQFNMGNMFRLGKGVPQDDVQAHMWLNLATAQGREDARKARDKLAEQMTPATAQGREDARKARDKLAEQMTPAQLAEAQRLAREWKPKQ